MGTSPDAVDAPPGRVPVGLAAHEKQVLAVEADAVVGVDAGKFEHALVVRPRGKPVGKPFKIPTTRAGFDAAIAHIAKAVPGASPGKVLIAIEFAGVYGYTFAHYLDARGYAVASVLPAHTHKWKEVEHNAPLKTDEKDTLTIVALAVQGKFTTFAFLRPEYAGLRYLVSAFERVTLQRNAALTRLRATLQIAFPEFESVFSNIAKQLTAIAILRAFPSADAVAAVSRRKLLRFIEKASHGHFGAEECDRLRAAAGATLAVPGASRALAVEIERLVGQVDLFTAQRKMLEQAMVEALGPLPEAAALRSIPGVEAVTAAVFLGSVGDPRAYASPRQVLKLAGLQLIEQSSGIHKGRVHISRRGKGVLRRHAYLYAMRAVREHGIYRDFYQRLLERQKPRTVALIAVACHAIELWYAVARSRAPYHPASHRGRRLAEEASIGAAIGSATHRAM